MRRLTNCTIVIALIVGLSACASVAPRGAFGAPDDATLAVRVKTSLLNDPVVHANEIQVDVRQGVVELTGTVHGEQEANAAVNAAKRVAGVKDVVSALQANR
jgi:hyperosmotically inducible periplasmic protein